MSTTNTKELTIALFSYLTTESLEIMGHFSMPLTPRLRPTDNHDNIVPQHKQTMSNLMWRSVPIYLFTQYALLNQVQGPIFPFPVESATG